ncbi:MAG: hypothetical protein Q4A21_03520 [bacterium]|nr:hypothetical protein [bacterium]
MKKNWLEAILDILAPDKCYYCERIGDAICNDCVEDFTMKQDGDLFYFESDQDQSKIRAIIDEMKEFSRKANARGLAKILTKGIRETPELRDDLNKIIFVGVPTSYKHIRQRGFCHTSLILNNLQDLLPIRIGDEIKRVGNLTQIGANRETRIDQASKSYKLSKTPQKDKIYIVLDDVHTTGATTKNIVRLLRDSGAEKVYRMVLIVHTNKK